MSSRSSDTGSESGRIRELTEAVPAPSKRDRWLLAAKTLVTVALLALLVWRIDLTESIQSIAGAIGPWLLLAVVSSVLGLVTSVLRWERLVRDLGIRASWTTLGALTTISSFVSAFLPGVVGGDLVRWQLAAQRFGHRLEMAATILADRVIGVVALALLAITVVAADWRQLATPPVLVLLTGTAAGLAVGLLLAFRRRPATTAMYWTRHSRAAFLIRPLYRLHRTFRRFGPSALFVAQAYGVIFHLSTGLLLYLLALAFGVELTYRDAVAAQVLSSLVALLPISIGGLGLVQAGDVYFLGLFGIDPSVALAMSIVRQGIHYLYALVGGGVFLRWSPQRRDPGAEDREVKELAPDQATGGSGST